MSSGFLGNRSTIVSAPPCVREKLTGVFCTATESFLSKQGYGVNPDPQNPNIHVLPFAVERDSRMLGMALVASQWPDPSKIIKRHDPLNGIFNMLKDWTPALMRLEAQLWPLPEKTGITVQFHPAFMSKLYVTLAEQKFEDLRQVRYSLQRAAPMVDEFQSNLK